MTTGSVLLQAGRVEAIRLCRNPIVVAAALASAGCIWWDNLRRVPLWWSADMQIGAWLLLLAGAVLIATHLAAGRARRHGMRQLYDSYPAPTAVRIGGLLLGSTGPVALAGAVTGAAVAFLDTEGAVGSPRLTVLGGGLLLVALGGAIGVALGSWLPHPLVGIMTAIALTFVEMDVVLGYTGWVQITGPGIWLFPWTWSGWVIGSLPGGFAAIPPAAHMAYLAALTGLISLLALWPALRGPALRGRGRQVAAGSAAVCVAVTCWSGWVQDQPVPVRAISRLVYQLTHPAQVEPCVIRASVRYCYYPAFAPMVPRWEVPVHRVLALLPGRPVRPLVVRQLDRGPDFAPPLMALLPDSQLAQQQLTLARRAYDFASRATIDPSFIPGSSNPPVYTDLNWGLGSRLAASQAGLAMTVAMWAVGMPTTEQMRTLRDSSGSMTTPVACVALGQAREAITIWLTASAVPASRPQYAGQLHLDGGYPATPIQVGTFWIDTYDGGWTNQGVTLANEMLARPRASVERVLAADWSHWRSPEATDAQLAAALGLATPALITVPGLGPDGQIPGTTDYTDPQPPSPVCK